MKSVTGNARLAKDDVRTEVARLEAQPGKDIGVGGAMLAGECLRQALVDEVRMCVYALVLGGGKPFFPTTEKRIPMRLIETRPFPDGVTYLRYAVERG